MDESIFGDEIDDSVELGDLHGDGEIVGSFRREENIHGFLSERSIPCRRSISTM